MSGERWEISRKTRLLFPYRVHVSQSMMKQGNTQVAMEGESDATGGLLRFCGATAAVKTKQPRS